ncbi:MAG: DinB family protein [Bacteroidota bacterium]
MIENTLSILYKTRENIYNLISAYSLEQLIEIPTGFNNNLLWNYGHVLVTQQLLCYKLSGNEILIDEDIVARYRKGTFPDHQDAATELTLFNQLCLEQVKRLEEDLGKGLFVEYKSYQTSFGIELKSIEDALLFNNAHEAMHLGSMLMIKKFV